MRYIIFTLLLLPFPARSQDWVSVARLLDQERAINKIPGYVAAVYWRGDIAWLKAAGLADLKTKRSVKAETPFRTASLAKPLSAVGLMSLVEALKLRLQDDVRQYCPNFPQKRQSIQLEQLLGHLGGIRHYRDAQDRNNQIHYSSVSESVKRFAADPPVHGPGEEFLYSTYGYGLLGCAIEGASGRTYAHWMQEKVFERAQMTGTGIDDGEGVSAERAQGYRLSESGKIENAFTSDNTGKIPGGGLVSTAGDLLRFADAIYTNRLLRRETIERMWTSGKLKSGKLTGYGLGWFLARSPDGDREIYHTGEQQGTSAMLYLRPENRFAFVFLCNMEGLENRVQLSRRVYRMVSRR